jgi:hypothetical protein
MSITCPSQLMMPAAWGQYLESAITTNGGKPGKSLSEALSDTLASVWRQGVAAMIRFAVADQGRPGDGSGRSAASTPVHNVERQARWDVMQYAYVASVAGAFYAVFWRYVLTLVCVLQGPTALAPSHQRRP